MEEKSESGGKVMAFTLPYFCEEKEMLPSTKVVGELRDQ